MQKQPSDVVGTMPLKNKQALLNSGAIFVFHQDDMVYIVSKAVDEIGNEAYKMEVIAFDEDYVYVHEEYYASLKSLESLEPFSLSKFSIVYLLPAAPSDVSQNDNKSIPRSDIIQAVVSFAGLAWSVHNITPYALDADMAPPEKQWNAWLVALTKPAMFGDKIQFLLAIHDGDKWLVLRPISIQMPEVATLDEVKCHFAIPGFSKVQRLLQEEQEHGKPITE